jgi:tetraacyldisaccharide 4'-kinase
MSRVGHNRVNDLWYGSSSLAWLLLPLSLLFGLAVALRRFLYARGILSVHESDVPVIVVGNISVGGTGKTPVTSWLARQLVRKGYRPAVVSRGYGGDVGPVPLVVDADSDSDSVGDEAILLARQCGCPVIVHPDRTAAAKKAVDAGADVIVSDDGLQHYRLGRCFEIVVVDGRRRFGNGFLLPAGPLREPRSRLRDVQAVAIHESSDGPGVAVDLPAGIDPLRFRLRVSEVRHLESGKTANLDDFHGRAVHAVAGIGHPERFFDMLESQDIAVIRHPLEDHATIRAEDLRFDDDLEVLMTEKDAVKCGAFDCHNCWSVHVDVSFDDGDRLLDAIEECLRRRGDSLS